MPARSAEDLTRVVIVGGGCAGMAAAWELAKQPGYDIHVYEKAPRLGGKGSSTRDQIDGRIYEHGLHVWMGWYENAFRMMRECYEIAGDEAWGKKAKVRTLAHRRFDDAFMPEPNVSLVDPSFHGQSVAWNVFFPPNAGLPGTPMKADDNPFTMASYMTRLFEMAKALVLSEVGNMPGDTPGAPRPDQRSRSDEILNLDMKTPAADSTAALLNRTAELWKAGALTVAAAMLQLVTILEVGLRQQNIGPKTPESTLAIAEATVSQARKLLRDVVGMDPRLRMKTEVIDIVLTIMIGLYKDRVMLQPDGLDSLNDFDYREWLGLHGATKTALQSRFIRAAYDFAFAYEDGDLAKPRLAAGIALRGGLRMFFTYRGAAFWRMCSGMGDAIFAPLYAVLEDWRAAPKARRAAKGAAKPEPLPPHLAKLKSPVQFHFGHELKAATFDAEGGSLTGLKFDQTAVGLPLVNGGWPQPSGPPPDSVVVDSLPLTRREDRRARLGALEFDFAIIATGIIEFDAVFVKPHADAKGRARHKPVPHKAWSATARLTKTVATKSAQVWLKKDLYQLGWRRGTGLFTCMGWETFDTYADMTHLIPTERAAEVRAAEARGQAAPRLKWGSIAYFCNPLSEKADAPGVEEDLETLVTEQMQAFWPKLFETDLKLPERRAAWKAGLDGSAKTYTRTNTQGSERYTLSLPGSIASRVSPLDPGIDNMTVAGDWTACGIDCGCVEAAVMSGMLAAAAISGSPKLSDIVGYDQP